MSIYKPSDSPYKQLTWIPTGFASLNKILGGGVPTRKITEISGVFSVGKSTLGLQICAQAQKMEMPVLWADTEYSFTDEYAEKLGVDLERIEILTERIAEDVLDAIEEWAENHKNAVIVIDSVGGLLPGQEREKNTGDKIIGAQARIIATFCRKIVPILAVNNIALIVLNHQFTDLMSGKLKTSGGEKLSYAKSIWLMLRAANKRIMAGENQVGLVIEAEIRKNKLAPTQKQSCELQMIFGDGFSADADLMQEAIDREIITKTGQMFYLGSEKIARGQNGLREKFKDADFAAKIKDLLGV